MFEKHLLKTAVHDRKCVAFFLLSYIFVTNFLMYGLNV